MEPHSIFNSPDINKWAESIYVHFPFCETKCHYCDFYSLAVSRVDADDHLNFEKALIQEVALQKGALAPRLKTIFLGGGTPTMTSAQSIEKVFREISQHTIIDEETEFTSEANPSSVTKEHISRLKKIGVNRISLGVQSTHNHHLKTLGRVHSWDNAKSAIRTIFESGIKNISVDLICGVPGLTLSELEESLKKLTDFPITHLSCYLLTLKKHNPLYKKLPGEDEQLEQLLFLDEWMKKNQFRHYEISNFCREGFRAKHNLAYWKKDGYLGFGPSAHSYEPITQMRWKNFSSLHKYWGRLINSSPALPIEWSETLTEEQVNIEKWMLALRLDEGFPKEWISLGKQKIAMLMENGLLEDHPTQSDFLRLTPRGFTLSDQVASELIHL